MITKLPYYDSLLKALYMHETFGVEFVVRTDISGTPKWHSLKHVTLDPCHPLALKASAKSLIFSQPVNRFYSPDVAFWNPREEDEVRVKGTFKDGSPCGCEVFDIVREEGRLWIDTRKGLYPLNKNEFEIRHMRAELEITEIATRFDPDIHKCLHFFHPDGWETIDYKQ